MHQGIGNERAKAVFHTHQEFGTTLACSAKNYELQMIHQNSARFYNSIIYDREFSGLADSFKEGVRISNKLKSADSRYRVLLQKHHGVFVIGPCASIAFDDVYWLEKACKV